MATYKHYKVLKDFPSRNGANQYKAGRVIQLDMNTRTKALVEMGYIKEAFLKSSPNMTADIALAIKRNIESVKHVRATLDHRTNTGAVYAVSIEEEQLFDRGSSNVLSKT
ncbi:MAG: hypothetical protein NC548_27145 [Lachnospiraceae bacterium]|nr:hypothetical protein [Lachnospiraceae bacterium]